MGVYSIKEKIKEEALQYIKHQRSQFKKKLEKRNNIKKMRKKLKVTVLI